MKPVQTRSFAADLEVRGSGDGRVVTGRAVPYLSPTTIYEGGRAFREQFMPGAFARSIAERGSRVKVLANHDHRQFPVGRPEKLWEDSSALWLEARISATSAGDDLLTLVGDGVVGGLSVGFRSINETYGPDDTREIREAALLEVSFVADPAYEDARVLSVRSALDQLEALALPSVPGEGPSLVAAYARLHELNRSH